MIIVPKKDQISTQGDPCWVPPQFPLDGRLKLTKEQLTKNIEKIGRDEFEHRSRCYLRSPSCNELSQMFNLMF